MRILIKQIVLKEKEIKKDKWRFFLYKNRLEERVN